MPDQTATTSLPETDSLHENAIDPHPAKGPSLTHRLVSEAAGSFLLVLAGLGVAMFNAQAGFGPAMAFGFALIVAYLAFGYAGAHFNPAVTLGSAIAGRTRWVHVLPLILVQTVGAAVASLMLWAMLVGHPQIPETSQLFSVAANGFGEHSPNAFPLTSVLLAEVLGTAVFVAIFLGATGRGRGRALAPFAIGFAYTVLLTFLIPLSNGSLNPARSTAAALFSDGWALGELWLFWAAPVLGAAIAGLIYRSVDVFAGTFPAGATSDADVFTAEAETGPEGKPVGEAIPVPEATQVPAADEQPRNSEAASTDEARSFFDGDTRK